MARTRPTDDDEPTEERIKIRGEGEDAWSTMSFHTGAGAVIDKGPLATGNLSQPVAHPDVDPADADLETLFEPDTQEGPDEETLGYATGERFEGS